jgi:UDP-N-acetyl-D-glucosamine dehydrogenase
MKTSRAADLRAALTAQTARVGVIGLGYVGLPLAATAAEHGFEVTGFDIDAAKVARLNGGGSYLSSVSGERIAAQVAGKKFRATEDFTELGRMDVIVICVPTPLSRHREPDLGYIESTSEAIARHLRPGQLVVLESTSYPGTTTSVVRPILEASGLRSARDFYLAYSPEREDPGNASFDLANIPKIIGADGPEALDLARTFYGHFVGSVVEVSSPETAEAAKLTENVFRAVNIALVNELKTVFDAMGVDVWEVIAAAKTKPFGFMPFYPGPGLGGHCVPIDPFYLTWKAREHGIATRFIELAGEINTAMPHYVLGKVREALDRRLGKGLNGTKVLLLGVAYKKNVDDMRESPALKLFEMIEGAGAEVSYHDPHLPEIPPSRAYGGLTGRKSTALTPEAVRAFDLALIVTDHSSVDYEMVLRECPCVVDTRNVTRGIPGAAQKVVMA